MAEEITPHKSSSSNERSPRRPYRKDFSDEETERRSRSRSFEKYRTRRNYKYPKYQPLDKKRFIKSTLPYPFLNVEQFRKRIERITVSFYLVNVNRGLRARPDIRRVQTRIRKENL